MALTVEDGTGLTDAEAYLSVADADIYHTAYGDPSNWSSSSTSQKEIALRQASEYMDARYQARWLGIRANSTQRMDWPRINAEDNDGFVLSSTSLPIELKDACAIIALKVRDGDTLLSDYYPGRVKNIDESVGPIKDVTEYLGGKSFNLHFALAYQRLGRLLFPTGRVYRG